MDTVKSTINLNRRYKEQLEYLVSIKKLDSVTEGINLAVADYVKAQRMELYIEQMRMAAKDSDFTKRTLSAQADFGSSDAECASEDGEW